jgi:hypothetical protein
VTVEDADTPELAAIAELARRRYRRWLVLIPGSTLIIGSLIGVLVAVHGHRHSERHHTSTAAAVTVLTVGVLLLAAEAGFLYWLAKSGRGFFKTPLVLGLPFRDRRRVMKAVRHGAPPPEPALRAVGSRMAERIVRYRVAAMVLYGILALSQLLNAVLPDRSGWARGLFGCGAGLFLCVLGYQRLVVAGARRYLEHVQRQDGG